MDKYTNPMDPMGFIYTPATSNGTELPIFGKLLGITCDFSQDLYGDDRGVQNAWHLQRERSVRRPCRRKNWISNGLLGKDVVDVFKLDELKYFFQIMLRCWTFAWPAVLRSYFCIFWWSAHEFDIPSVKWPAALGTRWCLFPKNCLASPLNSIHLTSCEVCVCVCHRKFTTPMQCLLLCVFQLNKTYRLVLGIIIILGKCLSYRTLGQLYPCSRSWDV